MLILCENQNANSELEEISVLDRYVMRALNHNILRTKARHLASSAVFIDGDILGKVVGEGTRAQPLTKTRNLDDELESRFEMISDE
ncbi:MAG: hypothetical protein DRG30_04355 [Epsilonproteobacteria bacterium]|nr:MAG: hypothetical protein DRG30_04355 [Campylobacterota bacterium]